LFYRILEVRMDVRSLLILLKSYTFNRWMVIQASLTVGKLHMIASKKRVNVCKRDCEITLIGDIRIIV
jgi:hypothetical protein